MSRSRKIQRREMALPQTGIEPDLISYTEKQLARGHEIQKVLVSLLALDNRTSADVAAGAKKLGMSKRQLFRYLKKYKGNPKVSTILGPGRTGGRGKSRLNPEVETIVQKAIEDIYLGIALSNVNHVYDEIKHECWKLDLKPPSNVTVYNRINNLTARTVVKKKRGKKIARDIFSPLKGETPPTFYPLQRVQIDHTRADIILVDTINRQPIGRPYITLIQDEYSRAIIGYYVSFEAPSSGTLAVAISIAVSNKNEICKRLGLTASWNIEGIPDLFYTDNAKEFVSDNLKAACLEWGMRPPEQRPKGMSHFGGYIERLMKTAMIAARIIPGATGSNVEDKGEYNPIKGASLTLNEFDAWVGEFLVGTYNQRRHSITGYPPIARWKMGIETSGNDISLGAPRKVDDPLKFFLDFLPNRKRTIQRYGIKSWCLTYWHDSMQRFLDNADEREFIVRYDPRDISVVWYLNPDDGKYYEARTPDPNFGPMPLKDWDRFLKERNRLGKELEDYDAIQRSYGRQKEIVSQAKSERRLVRSARTRERNLQASEGASRRPGGSQKMDQSLDEFIDDFMDIDTEIPDFYPSEKGSFQ